jgi:hypothetical protein
MMRRCLVVWLVWLAVSCTGCGLVADATSESEAEAQRHRTVHRWERESTVVATCTKPQEREGPQCGLLSDDLSPGDASLALPRRYPHASIAEMHGTCGLDASCDLRAREMVWLESHNRNVARIADERRHEEDASRRRRLHDAEWIVGVVAVSGALLAVGLGASVR